MLKLENIAWNTPSGEQIIQDVSYTAQMASLL